MSDLSLLPPPGSKPAVIVHAGAGIEAALPVYRASGAGRIVVIDPDELRAARLSQTHGDDARITVIHAALSPRKGPATLIRFNFAGLDSLAEPTGLRNLFPGLREKGRDLTPTLSPADLVQRCGLDAQAPGWLVIDMPGEELAIVTALLSSRSAQAFETLVIRAASQPLYHGASDIAALDSALAAAGFTLNRQISQDDSARPFLRLSCDAQRLALDAELETLRRRLAEQSARLSRQGKDAEKREAELTADCNEARASERQLTSQLAAAENARNLAAKERDEARDAEQALRERVTALDAAQKSLNTELTQSRSAHDTLGKNLATVTQERDAARDDTAKLRASLAAAQSRIEQLEKAAETAAKSSKVEMDRIAAARDDSQKKLDTARAELTRIEGQIDVIRVLLLQQGTRL